MRLSVRVLAQNAPFRRVRFSLPAQTWSRLTEKRILLRRPHGKAQCGWAASRKSAFWKVGVTGKRILRFSDRANCAFPSHCRPRGMRCNHPPGCGALSKVTQLGKCVRATTRQAAGRFAPGSANLVWSLTSRKVAVWMRRLGAQVGRAGWIRSLDAQSG